MSRKNLHIFVLNGPPRSGKNTFGTLVSEFLPEGSFLHTSSVDPVKTILKSEDVWEEGQIPLELWDNVRILKNKLTEDDWDGVTKDSFWRETMSRLKADIMEEIPDFLDDWVISVCKKAHVRTAFVDIREPEAIDKFKEYCLRAYPEVETGTILVVSDMAEVHDNSSDRRVLEYTYDITINNDRQVFGDDTDLSMKALKKEVKKFIKQFDL